MSKARAIILAVKLAKQHDTDYMVVRNSELPGPVTYDVMSTRAYWNSDYDKRDCIYNTTEGYYE